MACEIIEGGAHRGREEKPLRYDPGRFTRQGHGGEKKLDLRTLGEYVELILNEHFEGGKTIMTETKTLAFQIPGELDQRLKNFIASEKKRGRKISQKDFIVGLIEQALAEYEAQNPSEQ